jgi:hypothetical protein
MSEENKEQQKTKTLKEANILELKAAAFDLQNQLQQVLAELQNRENK